MKTDQWVRLGGMTLALAVSAGLLTGCAYMSGLSRGSDGESGESGEEAEFADLRQVSQNVADEIIAGFLGGLAEPPILMLLEIENQTRDEVDTGRLTGDIRNEISRSGRAQFVSESRLNRALDKRGVAPGGDVPMETYQEAGTELGAKYMMTGALEVIKPSARSKSRDTRGKEFTHQLTLAIRDLESGQAAWSTRRSFSRAALRDPGDN